MSSSSHGAMLEWWGVRDLHRPSPWGVLMVLRCPLHQLGSDSVSLPHPGTAPFSGGTFLMLFKTAVPRVPSGTCSNTKASSPPQTLASPESSRGGEGLPLQPLFNDGILHMQCCCSHVSPRILERQWGRRYLLWMRETSFRAYTRRPCLSIIRGLFLCTEPPSGRC